MCEYCGCRQVEPIAELMDEHFALLDEAHAIRRAMGAGDHETVVAHLDVLVGHLTRHVSREEAGVFTALRERDEFVDEVELLEKEHDVLDDKIAALDPRADDFESRVIALLAELDEHINRENLGIFPVSVVSLGAAGWETVARAHADSPSFLHEHAHDDDHPHPHPR